MSQEVRAGFRTPREPVVLHAELRNLIGAHGEAGTNQLVQQLSARLRRSWMDELRTRGVSATELRSIVRGYQHEAWLWVMGDRPWNALVDGLAGRIDRRFPAA